MTCSGQDGAEVLGFLDEGQGRYDSGWYRGFHGSYGCWRFVGPRVVGVELHEPLIFQILQLVNVYSWRILASCGVLMTLYPGNTGYVTGAAVDDTPSKVTCWVRRLRKSWIHASVLLRRTP